MPVLLIIIIIITS